MRYYLLQILTYIKYLTPAKASSAIKAMLSYYIAGLLKKPIVWGLPVSLSIEPTNHCNLNCPECPAAKSKSFRQRGFISDEMYYRIIDENARHTWHLMLYFQGEPFLHPSLNDFISYAVKKRIYTVTSTNGHYINHEMAGRIVTSGLHEIIVSMDGATQESYRKYRKNGSLSRVIAAIDYLQEWKRKMHRVYPLVHLQFLVFSHNEHEMEAMRSFSRMYHIDKLTFKSAQINSPANIRNMLPENPKYRRYQNPKGNIQEKKLKNQCKRLWTAPVITYNGLVLPCCFDKHARHAFGNIAGEPLQNLWQSPQFHAFRKMLLTNRKKIPMCNNCTQGIKVKW